MNITLNGVSKADLEAVGKLAGKGLTADEVADGIEAAHNSKTAIENIEGLGVTGSEIDDAVINGVFVSKKVASFNGTTSTVELNNDYILQSDGDSFEFVVKWNDLSSYPNSTEGIFGSKNNDNNQTIGLVSGNQLYIRGVTYDWMVFNIGSYFNPNVFNKFKLSVIGINLQLTLNDIVFGSVVLASPITINNIGQSYGTNYIDITVQYIDIQTESGNLYSNDIPNDIALTITNIREDSIDRTSLIYTNNGQGTFLIYKKQSNNKYMLLGI